MAIRRDSREIYVADYCNNRVQIFSPDGLQVVGKIGLESRIASNADGFFHGPMCVRFDRSNQLYVVDSQNGRVQIFSPTGQFAGKFGSEGSGVGQLSSPSGLAIAADGSVFVADSRNHRIQVFSKDGAFIRSFGSYGAQDGQFHYPAGIAIDVVGEVYVTAHETSRVRVCGAAGVFVRKFGTPGPLIGGEPKPYDGELNRPCGIVCDSRGNILVSDLFHSRVQAFTPEGVFLMKFGSYGFRGEEFQFNSPYDLALDAHDDLYVVNYGNQQAPHSGYHHIVKYRLR